MWLIKNIIEEYNKPCRYDRDARILWSVATAYRITQRLYIVICISIKGACSARVK
jgi:hypothetical protein